MQAKRNIGKGTDRVYIDPVQRRARWKLIAVGVRKKPINGRRATNLARRKSAETAKKLKKHKKLIHQNTKTKTEMEEAGEEEKGQGAPGLGTSSKLLEPGAKGTWGGGMAEAIPPPLQLRRSTMY
jgi:hypothetical protein